jgi:cytochrome oxidase assembly protein ShyY1
VKRIPGVAAAVVALAVAAMIGLGIWQLQRATWKEAKIAEYAANLTKPPISFPALAPVSDTAMFRKSSAMCVEVVRWRVEAGRTPTGQPGYRQIAECRTGAEGPGLIADMGLTADPRFKPQWKGGEVVGIITTEPSHASLIEMLFGRAPVLRPMLVADVPAPGLAASAPPSIEGISNNHRAYAVQWFIFAAVAAVIFALAVRRRG